MKIGSLVKNRFGNMGVISKRREGFRFHVWVQWCCGDACTIHTRHLEVIK